VEEKKMTWFRFHRVVSVTAIIFFFVVFSNLLYKVYSFQAQGPRFTCYDYLEHVEVYHDTEIETSICDS